MNRHRILVCLGLIAALRISPALAANHAAVGSYGFDASGADLAVKPGDDFNLFANGNWAKRTVIPEDHSSWGVWDVLEERSKSRVRGILEAAAKAHAPAGSNVRKVGDYYDSFMDETAIEKQGIAPLTQALAEISRINSSSTLAAAMGRAIRVGDSMPITLFVYPDFKRPETYAGYLDQGGLGLPDRDYYLQDSPEMAKARDAYRAYIVKLLELSNSSMTHVEAVKRASAVFDFEHGLAQIQWSRVRQRDIAARYVPWKRSDYPVKAPGLDWAAYFKAAGIDSQDVLIASVDSAITGTAAIVPKVPMPVWRDYLAVRTIDSHAQFLSKAFVDAHFAFHGTALQGTQTQQERWKRGSRFTQNALGEAIGEIYVREYFGPAAKASARRLVENLLAAAGHRLDTLDWMSSQTKAKAREKLATFGIKIGYPDKWRDYSQLNISAGDAYNNALNADRFEYQRNLAKLAGPVDRTEWDMTPMTINAYYDPTKNEVVFPAAVLQPPFFDSNADSAVNYGGIGAIIGHEISHGFDDQGRLFDAQGRLTDWWTEEDAAKYKQRTAALAAQYSAYEVLPGLRLNGDLTLGENIADNAGLVIAYDAYHASLNGSDAPIVDGRTGDERFFLGFAQVWRTAYREQITRQLIATDPHTPDAYRVRSVRNFDPWYAVFGVSPSDGLYLKPDARVRIW